MVRNFSFAELPDFCGSPAEATGEFRLSRDATVRFLRHRRAMNAVMICGSDFAVLVLNIHCPVMPKTRTVTMLNNDNPPTGSADEAISFSCFRSFAFS